jgi:hypothetical protein
VAQVLAQVLVALGVATARYNEILLLEARKQVDRALRKGTSRTLGVHAQSLSLKHNCHHVSTSALRALAASKA